MHNSIDAVARFCPSGPIADITDVEVPPERINIFAPSETKIIEHAHSHALLDEARNQVDADKTAASGHQVSFHSSLPIRIIARRSGRGFGCRPRDDIRDG